MIAVLATFFRTVGLTPDKVLIMVNNRRLMDSELVALAVSPEKRPAVSTWIDRRDKMTSADWIAYGVETGLSLEQINGIQDILENDSLWRKSGELVRLFAALEALGVSEYVRYNPGIVRGLLYYTGTVIEAQDISGEIRRAILGGGRYDNLMADIGGEPLPGVGFAMGDVVIGLVLEKNGLLPKNINFSPADVLVTVFDQERLSNSFKLASELRSAGIKVSCYPTDAKLPKQFKYADRMGIRIAAVIGPDEAANDQITIKDLRGGNQVTCPRDEAIETIRILLDGNPSL
jgi:histidyl-tRNA synthetase